MRTITIPQEVRALDTLDAPAINADGSPAFVTFADVIRGLFADARVVQTLGSFDSYDLRKKLLDAKKTVDVSDTEHTLLSDLATRPTTINPAGIPSVMPFLRAIRDAQTKP